MPHAKFQDHRTSGSGWRFTNVRKIKIIVRSNVSPKLRFTKVHLSSERLKSVRKFRATSGLL